MHLVIGTAGRLPASLEGAGPSPLGREQREFIDLLRKYLLRLSASIALDGGDTAVKKRECHCSSVRFSLML